MKNRIGIIVLVVACVGLVIGLVMVKKQAADQQQSANEQLGRFSNDLATANDKLDKQVQVNTTLEKDRADRKQAFEQLTNTYAEVAANLTQKTADLAKTDAALKASEAEVAKRDAKITQLENENQALDKQAADLSGTLTNLNVQIADTQRRLASSEGDKALLEKELKRLMADKAELERQFNDLTVLRAQVAKLKEQFNVARRLDWMRQGLLANTEQKGAQKLMQGSPSPQVMQVKSTKVPYDLNVEVNADGSVKVIPPLNNRPDATNSPPPK